METTPVMQRMKKNTKRSSQMKLIFPFALSFAMLFSGCTRGGNGGSALPLLSLLVNNRVVLLLKGTYASDNPLSHQEINGNALFVDADDTLAPDLKSVPTASALNLYIDIGEVRLSKKDFLSDLSLITTPTKSQQFWQVLSPTRQVYCSNLYAIHSAMDGCMKTGGLVNYIEFMNGTGALYPSHGAGAGTYLHSGVFIRGIVTSFSKTNGVQDTTRFDNNDVFGTNILKTVNFDPGVTGTQQALAVPQLFPIHHKVTWGQQVTTDLDDTFRTAVIEVRMNLKENLMVHAFKDVNANNRTIVAFSDWRKNHTSETTVGGNVLSRFKIFYPDVAGALQITGGTASSRHYYALYIHNECIDMNGAKACNKDLEYLPYAATPVRNGTNVMKNINPGKYVLQCRYDAVYDGYPEQVLSEKLIQIGGPATTTIACPCGSSPTTGCP